MSAGNCGGSWTWRLLPGISSASAALMRTSYVAGISLSVMWQLAPASIQRRAVINWVIAKADCLSATSRYVRIRRTREVGLASLS